MLLEFTYQRWFIFVQLAAYLKMDNSDEESQNSSENSFSEMVTAAMAAGYAFAHMLQVPPQGNHVISVPELTRRQWVDKLLLDARRQNMLDSPPRGIPRW